MDRRNFIKTSCIACAGSMAWMTFLQSCSGQKHIQNFELKENKITIKKTEFASIKKGKSVQLPFIVVKVEQFPFPIAVYKNKEEYKALYLLCTHQGCELNPYETMLVCPCHGAEFNPNGEVTQGPAEMNLTTFITTHDHESIYIQLV